MFLKNVDALHDFIKSNSAFQTFLKSQEYDNYHRQYKARFPQDF